MGISNFRSRDSIAKKKASLGKPFFYLENKILNTIRKGERSFSRILK